MRLAERISASALPSLQDIYLKRCKSRAAKIIKDSNHPGNRLSILLPSGKRFRCMMAKTERFRRSFFPQAIRLRTRTRSHNINMTQFNKQQDLHYSPSSVLLLCVYTLYNLFTHSSSSWCPCLYYYLLSPQYTYCTFYSLFFLIIFIFYLYLYLSSCVVLHILHCPLSGPDLTYISLLIIFWIIEYVMNKKPWTLNINQQAWL